MQDKENLFLNTSPIHLKRNESVFHIELFDYGRHSSILILELGGNDLKINLQKPPAKNDPKTDLKHSFKTK